MPKPRRNRNRFLEFAKEGFGTPLRDGSGRGIRANRGRGGCRFLRKRRQ
jgi:hypothetical protein